MDFREPNGFFEFGEDEFGGDDYEDFEDDDFEDDGSDISQSECFDIPDLPDSLMNRGSDGMPPILSDAELEKIWYDERTRLETVCDPARVERIPGISRFLLSVKGECRTSFGTNLCQSLTTELNIYFDKLLFGLTDGIYLHSIRMEKFERDQSKVSVSVRFFWDEKESPYRLIIPDILVIKKNMVLTYLLVGDLLEEFLDGLEKSTNDEIRGGRDP